MKNDRSTKKKVVPPSTRIDAHSSQYAHRAEKWLQTLLEWSDEYDAGEALSFLASRGKADPAYCDRILNACENDPFDYYEQFPLAAPTVLRAIELCGKSRFEPHVNLFAKKERELLLLSPPKPREYAPRLVGLCRSDLAMKSMKRVLAAGFELISWTPIGSTLPWVKSFALRAPADGCIEEDLRHAAAVAFAGRRLLHEADPAIQLVKEAATYLRRNQRADGAWPRWASSSTGSVEVTAIALHALALCQSKKAKRALRAGAEWLLGKQTEEGFWADPQCERTAYLTVLVLDAIGLAYGHRQLTVTL